jgi:hypothetical protein
MRKLDEEQERLVATIAIAGQVDALARARQARERQKRGSSQNSRPSVK